MTENEMIEILEAAVRSAEQRGLSTGFAPSCLDVGEWGVALFELIALAEENAEFRTEWAERLDAIHAYMDRPPNPFDGAEAGRV